MKRLLGIILMMAVMVTAAPVQANLDDTRASIESKYGEYRLVLDTNNQPWTKEQWEKSGYKKADAATFMYRFRRFDMGIQLDVAFEDNKPNAYVKMQRFTPDNPIQIKDFKKIFPEVYDLLVSPKAVSFTSFKELTKNFTEQGSPVTYGIAINQPPTPDRKAYITLCAFSITDEGRVVKEVKYIDENTYIREFTIERLWTGVFNEYINNDWKKIKNFFIAPVK